ncbi:hypothetical protein LA03_14105 [Burkholderia gladioli]|uniref:hypothetical protein n=1 Tax=Burkholderia gladioli TaxID=28095 RepID=UPI00050FB28A|nr:hypothetical protein [Burkholderia gladioli]KGE09828.1 hypothetical protein LA03_14105 [Burkholderia gladioli]
MAMTAQSLQSLLVQAPSVVWTDVFSDVWERMSQPVSGDVASEMVRRDKDIEGLDLVLSSAAWDLWSHFEACAPKTSKALQDFWSASHGSKAILVLDALSLREAPWILQEAPKRGFKVHEGRATGSALPSDTTSFAKELGMSQRSVLTSGQVGSLKLAGAATALFAQPWLECANTLPNHPDLFVWHDWPDSLMHDLSGPGPGLRQLAEDAKTVLTGDDFWTFVERLATGRRLIITADHGYAASGQFSDVLDQEQKEYFQKTFGAERFASSSDKVQSHWLPPVDIPLTTTRGDYRFALGRRAWSVQGGRKNLSHGGISLLEVAVPFIELSRAL